MIVNLIDISNNTNYEGMFSGDITTSYNREINRTYLASDMLDIKSKNMNQKQLIEILRTQFDGDVKLLAKHSGWQIDDIYKMLTGSIESIEGFPFETKRSGQSNIGDNIQIGDKIEIHAGDGNTNNFGEVLKEKLKAEKNRTKDLEQLLKDKEELIATLEENIELLKKK